MTLRKEFALALNIPIILVLGIFLFIDFIYQRKYLLDEAMGGLEEDALHLALSVGKLRTLEEVQDFTVDFCKLMALCGKPGHMVLVADGEDKILASGMLADSALAKRLVKASSSATEEIEYKGRRIILKTSRIRGGNVLDELSGARVINSRRVSDVLEGIQDTLFYRLAALGVLAGGILVVLNVILQKVVVTPLKLFEKAVTEIHSRGPGAKVTLPRHDELGHLASVFNEMSAKLKKERDQDIHEMQKAADIQERLLPRKDISVPGLRIETRYLPARVVGGDFFDIFRIAEGRWGILMADAQGHGYYSALLATMVKILFNKLAEGHSDPAMVVNEANRALVSMLGSEVVASVFFATCNAADDTFSFCNAGHPPGILYACNSGRSEALTEGGMLIGIDAETDYESKQVQLRPGERIFLYTDGLIETTGKNSERFGVARAQEFITSNRNRPLAGNVDSVIEALKKFRRHAQQEDDIAIVALEKE